MIEDGIEIKKGMCEDDLSTKIEGGEVEVDIETELKYKESQGLERAISRQPWWKIIKYQSKSKLRWEFDGSSAFTKAR